jgi:hypothetical protein
MIQHIIIFVEYGKIFMDFLVLLFMYAYSQTHRVTHLTLINASVEMENSEADFVWSFGVQYRTSQGVLEWSRE